MSDIEKTIERAQRMLADLKEAKVPRSRIAKEAGVNDVTLWQIGRGGQSKISERVFDAIWDYWSENAPPKDNGQASQDQEAAGDPIGTAPTAETGEQSPAPEKPARGRRKAAGKPGPTSKPKTAKEPTSAAKRGGKGQKAGDARSKELKPLDFAGMINRDYVVVDLKALEALLDGMTERLRGQMEELDEIRNSIGSNYSRLKGV